MKLGSLELNVKKGSTQIQKVMLGAQKIWENFKVWSTTIQNPSSFSACEGFPNSQYVTFTNDGSYKVTNVTATAHVLCHGNLGDDMSVLSATATATIEVSNDNSKWTEVARSSTATADRIQNATAEASVSHAWKDGCPYKYIRCGTHGTSFKRYVVAQLSGYHKG